MIAGHEGAQALGGAGKELVQVQDIHVRGWQGELPKCVTSQRGRSVHVCRGLKRPFAGPQTHSCPSYQIPVAHRRRGQESRIAVLLDGGSYHARDERRVRLR